MIQKIDHAALVVKNTLETIDLYTSIFGFKVISSVNDPQGDFKSTIISVNEASLELIEPLNPKGNIARFLESRGPGLHHLSLEVENLEETMHALAKKGVTLLSKTPQSLEGRKVAFVHPRSTGGLLIELVEIDYSA